MAGINQGMAILKPLTLHWGQLQVVSVPMADLHPLRLNRSHQGGGVSSFMTGQPTKQRSGYLLLIMLETHVIEGMKQQQAEQGSRQQRREHTTEDTDEKTIHARSTYSIQEN